MRTIKFRAFWKDTLEPVDGSDDGYNFPLWDISEPDMYIMQYTGLTDKNGLTEIYEYDIIDSDGNILGNKYENSDLLKEETNLTIEGFGTKDWIATYKEAVERGCKDS